MKKHIYKVNAYDALILAYYRVKYLALQYEYYGLLILIVCLLTKIDFLLWLIPIILLGFIYYFCDFWNYESDIHLIIKKYQQNYHSSFDFLKSLPNFSTNFNTIHDQNLSVFSNPAASSTKKPTNNIQNSKPSPLQNKNEIKPPKNGSFLLEILQEFIKKIKKIYYEYNIFKRFSPPGNKSLYLTKILREESLKKQMTAQENQIIIPNTTHITKSKIIKKTEDIKIKPLSIKSMKPPSSATLRKIPSISIRNKRKNIGSKYLNRKTLRNNIPTETLAKENILNNEAEECFKKLEINLYMSRWISNCKVWVFDELIEEIFQRNIRNIININTILQDHYGYRLEEFEFFYQTKLNEKNRDFRVIGFDYLINNYLFERDFLGEYPENIKERMKELLVERALLDGFLEMKTKTISISAYRTSLLFKLLDILEKGIESIKFSEGEIKNNLKSPSDVEFIANLFSNYLVHHIFGVQPSFFSSILFDETEEGMKDSNFPFNIHFQQINPYNYDPHYQIVVENDIWQALPGKNNIFCAIVLYFYAISKDFRFNLVRYPELKRIICLIIA